MKNSYQAIENSKGASAVQRLAVEIQNLNDLVQTGQEFESNQIAYIKALLAQAESHIETNGEI